MYCSICKEFLLMEGNCHLNSNAFGATPFVRLKINWLNELNFESGH